MEIHLKDLKKLKTDDFWLATRIAREINIQENNKDIFKTCLCDDINMWSYGFQVSMLAPFKIYNILWKEKKHLHQYREDNTFAWSWVCIDICIASEIAILWKKWIETIECCCGHNKVIGYIVVKEKSIDKMLKLWYNQQKHWIQFFTPKYLLNN